MKQGKFRLACASSITIAVALWAAPAMAQGASADSDGIEEIVVTAQKRAQSLQDVPMAISAVSGDTLRDAGTIGIDGLANLVPSLATVSNNQPLAQSYRIRGLGSDPSIPTFEPSVALFIDGVYMPRTGLGVDDLVDIARVEVLKGPQSTLHGKNATAGVISVVSARPGSEFAANGSLRWPVQGPILISYGSPRTAELKWKGTLIGASEGTQVKAVAPGQVVYADWLDGFGMLLVIDHGRGYMSLYGHNQSLLRQVGQSVEQGEPVALVGDSGGQERSGLYFEIRYQGEAINPTKWLAKG